MVKPETRKALKASVWPRKRGKRWWERKVDERPMKVQIVAPRIAADCEDQLADC